MNDPAHQKPNVFIEAEKQYIMFQNIKVSVFIPKMKFSSGAQQVQQ